VLLRLSYWSLSKLRQTASSAPKQGCVFISLSDDHAIRSQNVVDFMLSNASEPTTKVRYDVAEALDCNESLVVAFERVARAFPSRIAVNSDVWQPTYRELNETANRLAHRLANHGSEFEHRAAILMSNDAPMVAAALGVLKAGQTIVPLDPGDPLARLRMLAEDAEPAFIITDAQNRSIATALVGADCRILDFEAAATTGSVENPCVSISPEWTAFLTYTSGTTGRPKGVMRPHLQPLKTATVYSEALQSTHNDRIPLFSSVSTGQCWNTICWSLLNGAMLCPYRVRTRGIRGLADWIIDRRLTVYSSSASIFRSLIKTIDDRLVFSTVRAVRLASEPVTVDDFNAFRKHFPEGSVLVHGLTCSESAPIAWGRWTQGAKLPERVLPIGHVARGMDVSLLGEDGLPVRLGEVGEIVIKSRYVAKGYWRDSELTATRFSAELDTNGIRLVRTGDLGRINADGFLEFCGRRDDRIKIRGNRIEPIEIERALERLPGIDRAAVVAVRRENHEPLLVAFVEKASDASWTGPRLRYALKGNLPLHMVPSRIVFLDNLPYNKGNKIDREALRQFSLPVRDGNNSNWPQTETEILLADIWAESLDLADIDRNDDFFDLGGDSLSGAVVAARVYAKLGIELNLGELADNSTLARLSAFIDGRHRGGALKTTPVVRVPRASTMPMSLSQEAIWNHWRHQDRAGLTHVTTYRVTGSVDIEILKHCLSFLIDRHAILRTTFGVVDGCPMQIIHPSAPVGFSFIDLIGANNPEGEAGSIVHEEASREIDLEKLPIKRDILIRIADKNYRLICISHPLITDGLAFQILHSEFATLYEAMLHGREPPFPIEPPLQYADYAVWQRKVMRSDSPYFNAAADWWRKNLSAVLKANPLPFTRLIRRAPLDPSEGFLQWKLEEGAAKRLDEIARGAGATHFIVRLAAFAALIADVTASSTIVIGTAFANRNHVETQNIVGRFVNTVHLVFSYDANKTFLEWLEFVRDQVFEASTRSELPYDTLRASGVEPPEIEFYFTMASDHSDQHFGNLTISSEFCSVGAIPWKCLFEIDERKSENCRVSFDANLYDRKEMRVMLDRYLRLVETAAREPELPISKLLAKTGAKPLRWTCANYAAPFYEFITSFYASSPILKMCWRPIRRWVLSGS
jgi:amino acid adenylation domain-containing protein